MSDPRYPIGPFAVPDRFTPASRAAAIAALARLPDELGAAIAGLAPEQLDTAYREGGWTVRQLVHHVADSHANAYVRHKLTVAEDEPTIRPYDETAWAELPEARLADPQISLRLLDGLHRRWAAFLGALPPAAFARCFVHPELERPRSLDASLEHYVWHGRHHTAHVLGLRAARGW